MSKGLLVVISGASGTGKGTVCSALLHEEERLIYSISATTRAMREGEVEGREYYFRTREQFEALIADYGFLEYASVYDNYYGTPRQMVEEKMAAGNDVLLEIDPQGALQVMEKVPDGVFIFLLPPSMEELKKRIVGRGTDEPAVIAKRLQAAEAEIETGKKYSYVVVNDKVEKAVMSIRSILVAERLRAARNMELFEV